MFTTKYTLKKLNNIIDTLRTEIKNNEVLEYVLSNLADSTKKGVIIKTEGNNKILIIDNRRNRAFFLEVSPNMDRIDKIYARLTTGAGNHDERFTATFEGDVVTIHQYSSTIVKNLDDERVELITDIFSDKVYINDEIRFVRKFESNTEYPHVENARVSSSLEEITIDANKDAVFKQVMLSSEVGETRRFGLFDAEANEFSSTSTINSLSSVQRIEESDYLEFIEKTDPRITKELK